MVAILNFEYVRKVRSVAHAREQNHSLSIISNLVPINHFRVHATDVKQIHTIIQQKNRFIGTLTFKCEVSSLFESSETPNQNTYLQLASGN